MQKPVPKENEILIKIKSASITTADSMMRQGTPFYGRLFIGLLRPKHPITGTGFSGEIMGKGSEVAKFNLGEEVYGETLFSFGSNAEYIVVSENGIVTHKPENITFQEAACVCDGALTSLNFLSKALKALILIIHLSLSPNLAFSVPLLEP